MAAAKKKPIKTVASSGHITNIKQSILETFDIYKTNSGCMVYGQASADRTKSGCMVYGQASADRTKSGCMVYGKASADRTKSGPSFQLWKWQHALTVLIYLKMASI
jgi:hypothetical protein